MKSINSRGWWLARAMVIALVFLFVACGSGSPSDDTGTEDTDTGTGTGTDDTDTGTGTGTDTDTGTGTDTDTDTTIPALPGAACWNEFIDKLWPFHPNEGLSDCSDGFTCIGDEDEAWCTKKCGDMVNTGDENTEDEGIIGWCCGEMIDPCDPFRYWLPDTMNYYCIPKITPLAQDCEVPTEWTGKEELCAPVCNGDETVHVTYCAQYEDDYGIPGSFCTFACDPENGNGDCVLQPEFEKGTCGEIMGGWYCLIPELS